MFLRGNPSGIQHRHLFSEVLQPGPQAHRGSAWSLASDCHNGPQELVAESPMAPKKSRGRLYRVARSIHLDQPTNPHAMTLAESIDSAATNSLSAHCGFVAGQLPQTTSVAAQANTISIGSTCNQRTPRQRRMQMPSPVRGEVELWPPTHSSWINRHKSYG